MMMLPPVVARHRPDGHGRRGHRPRESFDITDSDLVTIELLSGFLSLTHPDERQTYRELDGQVFCVNSMAASTPW